MSVEKPRVYHPGLPSNQDVLYVIRSLLNRLSRAYPTIKMGLIETYINRQQ